MIAVLFGVSLLAQLPGRACPRPRSASRNVRRRALSRRDAEDGATFTQIALAN
jgi:hypothetical protein